MNPGSWSVRKVFHLDMARVERTRKVSRLPSKDSVFTTVVITTGAGGHSYQERVRIVESRQSNILHLAVAGLAANSYNSKTALVPLL